MATILGGTHLSVAQLNYLKELGGCGDCGDDCITVCRLNAECTGCGAPVTIPDVKYEPRHIRFVKGDK